MAMSPLADNVVVWCDRGTTNAGIVDDRGSGTFARENDLWYHVDGAYARRVVLTFPTPLFSGMRHADSFIVDPHKWLYAR